MSETVNDKYRRWMRQGQDLVYEVRGTICSFAVGLMPYTFVGADGLFEEIHEADGKLWVTLKGRPGDVLPVENMDIVAAYTLLQQLQEEHHLMLKAKTTPPQQPFINP